VRLEFQLLQRPAIGRPADAARAGDRSRDGAGCRARAGMRQRGRNRNGTDPAVAPGAVGRAAGPRGRAGAGPVAAAEPGPVAESSVPVTAPMPGPAVGLQPELTNLATATEPVTFPEPE